jgi:NlpC/P60 family putative phage cell wall peptidase
MANSEWSSEREDDESLFATRHSPLAAAAIAAARSWIGTPYIHQASLKHIGCDCLGLLRGIWRELHGDEPQSIPPYSGDWAETSGEETLANALRIHLHEIEKQTIAPGDIAVFRMLPHMPAKHCGVIAPYPPPERGRSICAADRVGKEPNMLSLIHARQNHRVSEEPLTQSWRRKLAYAFRL